MGDDYTRLPLPDFMRPAAAPVRPLAAGSLAAEQVRYSSTLDVIF